MGKINEPQMFKNVVFKIYKHLKELRTLYVFYLGLNRFP